MDIYVVQPGDTLNSIAEQFGVTIEKLIRDNGIINPFALVPGQTIVISYPSLTYTVQAGDTLGSIAEGHGISVMQLLRNNPFLSEREFIFPGEILTISYPTEGELMTFGYAYPFIQEKALLKTLPNLTYLSVYNYRATDEGEISSYMDDSEIIRLAKEYNTIPLALMTTLTAQGAPDLEVAYKLLLNEEFQDNQLNNLIDIIRGKDYSGVNFVFNYMNQDNQELYDSFVEKASARIKSEGYLVFVTINPNISNEGSEIIFERVDYSRINQAVDGVIFLQFIWGINKNPPAPVSSITNLRSFVDHAITTVPADKMIIAKPIIAYDWELPYSPENKGVSSLTIDTALTVANDYNATIQFDETSMTPYFLYNKSGIGSLINHMVWSMDARSINALLNLLSDYDIAGAGIWNNMIYVQQLWTILNSRFQIIKILPEQINQLTQTEG